VQEKSKDTFVQINNQLMSVLILLIAFSILIAGGFLAAFIWSVKKGQFDDDYTPSVRILMDDNAISNPSKGKETANNESHLPEIQIEK
jgi:cbb3-type cytochrome oxidase maturation protein